MSDYNHPIDHAAFQSNNNASMDGTEAIPSTPHAAPDGKEAISSNTDASTNSNEGGLGKNSHRIDSRRVIHTHYEVSIH
jgi:hypothetical protein